MNDLPDDLNQGECKTLFEKKELKKEKENDKIFKRLLKFNIEKLLMDISD